MLWGLNQLKGCSMSGGSLVLTGATGTHPCWAVPRKKHVSGYLNLLNLNLKWMATCTVVTLGPSMYVSHKCGAEGSLQIILPIHNSERACYLIKNQKQFCNVIVMTPLHLVSQADLSYKYILYIVSTAMILYFFGFKNSISVGTLDLKLPEEWSALWC